VYRQQSTSLLTFCLTLPIPNTIQYKSKLSKAELRSFHRSQIQFPLHTEITFSRIKARKKRKKDKKKEAAETMRTSKDLTLKDNTYFTLLEYSVSF
jgi:transcription initiation factor TFIID subunit 1